MADAHRIAGDPEVIKDICGLIAKLGRSFKCIHTWIDEKSQALYGEAPNAQ